MISSARANNNTILQCELSILDNAGKVSHELAKEIAEKEYDKYYKKGLKMPSKADKDFEAFTKKAIELVSKGKKKQ